MDYGGKWQDWVFKSVNSISTYSPTKGHIHGVSASCANIKYTILFFNEWFQVKYQIGHTC